MWTMVLAATAFGADDPGPPLLREPPPYGLPPKVEWIVRYEDGTALDTPSLFLATDAPIELREEFRRDQNRRMAAGVALGLSGVVVILGGWTAATVILANTYDETTGTAEFTGIAIASTVVGTLLELAAAGPMTKHSRHRKYPSMALTEQQADELIARHNAALASP